MTSARIQRVGTARLSALLITAVTLLATAPTPLHAQDSDKWAHGGLGLSLLSSRGPDSFTGEKISARGWGGIAWAPIQPSLHAYASLEGFTNPDGTTPKKFGVFNVVFTVPFHDVPFGFVPFVGAGVGLGGGAVGLTPVLSAGTLWSRGPGLVPFMMVERLTRRDRTTLRLGVWVGI